MPKAKSEYHLRHPSGGFVITVNDEARRDTFLSRGYTSVEDTPEVKPQPDQKRRTSKPKPKSDEE